MDQCRLAHSSKKKNIPIRLDFIYVYLTVACNFVRRPKDLSVCGFQFCLKTLEKKSYKKKRSGGKRYVFEIRKKKQLYFIVCYLSQAHHQCVPCTLLLLKY